MKKIVIILFSVLNSSTFGGLNNDQIKLKNILYNATEEFLIKDPSSPVLVPLQYAIKGMQFYRASIYAKDNGKGDKYKKEASDCFCQALKSQYLPLKVAYEIRTHIPELTL